jgi:ankyrin repeat protein
MSIPSREDLFTELKRAFATDDVSSFWNLLDLGNLSPIDSHLENPGKRPIWNHSALDRNPTLLSVACFYSARSIYASIIDRFFTPLLAQMPDLTLESIFVRTPGSFSLMIYALIGRPPVPEIVEDLLARGSDLSGCLEYAIQLRSVPLFELLFQAVVGGESDPANALFGNVGELSPLGLAIETGDLEMVRAILEICGHLEQPLLRGGKRTPLYKSLKYRAKEIIQLFIGDSAQLGRVHGRTGETFLITYVRHAVAAAGTLGAEELDAVVFGAGVDWEGIINVRDKRGRTALHWACVNSRHALVDRLLGIAPAMVRVGLADCWGMSALHYAVKNSDVECMAKICTFLHERDRVLFSEDCDVEKDADDTGQNLLHTAARQKWMAGVQYLIERYPGLALAPDVSGLTPVVNTAIYESLDCFNLFLTEGIVSSVAMRSELTEWTFLHFAAHTGAAEVLQAAIRENTKWKWWDGPDILAQEPKVTPLALASKAGHLGCVNVLLEAGANPLAEGGPRTAQDGAWKCKGEIADALTEAAKAFGPKSGGTVRGEVLVV